MRYALLVVALVLVSAGAVAAQQPPLLINPSGTLVFESADHAKAASYRVGWFKSDTDAEPAVSETIPASDVTVPTPGATVGLSAAAKTRPPFAKYTLRIKMIASACDPGFCESPWSEPGVWTQDAATGTWTGYVPRRMTGFVLK